MTPKGTTGASNESWKDFPGSSAGKESACNVGDPVSTPGSGRSAGEGIGYPLQYSWTSLVAQLVKNPLAVGDLDSIPGLGRSPGEGNGYPLQYSGLKKSMDGMVHGVAQSWTRLSNFHFFMRCCDRQDPSWPQVVSTSWYLHPHLIPCLHCQPP